MGQFCFDCNFPPLEAHLPFYAPSHLNTGGLDVLFHALSEGADAWTNLSQIAYLLATVNWETMHTFQPIHEMGSLSYFDKYEAGTAIGQTLGNTQPGDGFLYRGRGYVQITGRDNYTHIGQLLNVDLVKFPDLALVPDIAYRIAASGMQQGWFTGRRLSQYLPDGGPPDYVNARRIINGLDHAPEIAAIAENFYTVLNAPAGGCG